jgi:alkylation response protein AidB-like acyl-CoA dehydrogenase
VFLKRADCAIVDTWYAGGLRGTGSHDVVVDGVWAPRSHCVYFDQPAQLTSPLYRMPFVAMLAAGCASVCLGIARAALQTLLDIAQAKPLVDRATWLRDQPHLLVEIPRLQAVLSGARLVLAETVTSAWRSCESSEPVSSIRRAAMLAAAQHAASNAKHIVRTCYELAGSNALYESCPIERAHRDIHAALQHVIMQKMWLEDAGRAVLGVTPLSPLFHV